MYSKLFKYGCSKLWNNLNWLALTKGRMCLKLLNKVYKSIFLLENFKLIFYNKLLDVKESVWHIVLQIKLIFMHCYYYYTNLYQTKKISAKAKSIHVIEPKGQNKN